jgi:ribonuclease P protein component
MYTDWSVYLKRKQLEANISAEQEKKEENPRIPCQDEHQSRTSRDQETSRQGQEEAIGLGSLSRSVDKKNRLTRSADFQRVYRKGKSVAGRHAVLYYFDRSEEAGEEGPRLGISVSKKVGGAVVRNQVKRVVKESFDRFQDKVAPDYDYVIIARPGLASFIEESRFEEVVGMMSDLFQRAELTQDPD